MASRKKAPARRPRRAVARKPRPKEPAAGAIYGIGVDLLRQERVDRVHARHPERFANKILCEAELAEFARSKRPARYLAMAFAVKEAFVKALGTGFRGVSYRDAGTLHEKSGKPVLVYSRAMEARLARLGVGAGHVTLTDEGGMICAMVVLERHVVACAS